MDTTASDITFHENGYCNYCSDLLQRLKQSSVDEELSRKRDLLIEQIKKDGKNKPYDCIIGVSGGVDSSYVLLMAIQYGLRPLAVHLDNGWNSELANNNITNLVNKLEVDLFTHVVDWEVNKDLQLSFFAANVIDIEMLMDNAMKALNYNQAKKYHLKYILGGTNTSTEGMRMPPEWNHYKLDKKNILSIHRKFGKLKIMTTLFISTCVFLWNKYVAKCDWVDFLDYFDYKKDDALDILVKEVDYKPYPYKHYESVFTRFYQGYILPNKFKIDKRRLHLSTLVISGQMTRDEALRLLEDDPYPDLGQKQHDKAIVMEKLGFTEESFDEYINTPAIPHKYYGSEEWIMKMLIRINKLRRKLFR
jgi:N-acetyl sugar amidotransferase